MFEFTLQGRQVNFPPFRAFAYFRHLACVREVFRDGVIKLNRVGILVVFRHEHLKKGKLRRLQFSECSLLAVVNVAAARLVVPGLFAHNFVLRFLEGRQLVLARQHRPARLSWPPRPFLDSRAPTRPLAPATTLWKFPQGRSVRLGAWWP